MITLDKIVKKYRTDYVETTALNGINLTIEHGEFLGITGPSGCGKSTLLSILGFLDTPDSGEIVFNGETIFPLPRSKTTARYRRRIGFIFQSFNLINSLTVQENIMLPLKYSGVRKTEQVARSQGILKKLDIEHRASHRPNQLSGGQQQRVAIARALVHQPDVIIADEPTGNLDSLNAQQTLELIKSINASGTSVVMVTHDDSQKSYFSRCIEMKDGEFLRSNG